METVDKLKKTLIKESKKLKDNNVFQNHMDYYNGLKEKGIIKKQRYSIPSPDTLGKRVLSKSNV